MTSLVLPLLRLDDEGDANEAEQGEPARAGARHLPVPAAAPVTVAAPAAATVTVAAPAVTAVTADKAAAAQNGDHGAGRRHRRRAAGDQDECDPLASWVWVASASSDTCLVVDEAGRVVGVSGPAAELLGERPESMVGRKLLEDVLSVLGLSDGTRPAQEHAGRIPPMMAVTSNVLSRGLIRVHRKDGHRLTLDAVAAPLHGRRGQGVVGSLTFLAAL